MAAVSSSLGLRVNDVVFQKLRKSVELKRTRLNPPPAERKRATSLDKVGTETVGAAPSVRWKPTSP